MKSSLRNSVFLIGLPMLVACGNGFATFTPMAGVENLPTETIDELPLPEDGQPQPEPPAGTPDQVGAPTPTPFPKPPPLPEPNGSNNSHPAANPSFATLPNGKKLSSFSVSGVSLSLVKGSGQTFSESKHQEYLKLRSATQTDASHPVQWVLMDLDAHQVLGKSLSSHKRIFGASSSKIYVAAALFDWLKGTVSSKQFALMASMLVVSSNTAWTDLQKQLGDGNSDKGRERIQEFTRRMGYKHTRGFQGYLGKYHGNELVPDEAAETLYDLYTNAFPGAEYVWKLMHTSRTGASRGRKYIPKNIYVGGKTGTYDGPTENPETGQQYNVRIRNHIMVFAVNGRQYGLVVLANSGSDESAALLAGGLVREL